MNCANCGAENAADARYCARCGAEQPRATARPRRGATIAIVVSCVVVLLAGYGGWKLMSGVWSGSEAPLPQAKVVQVPAGNAPPPTDQSAAPLPPPSALPETSDLAAQSASAAKSATAGSESTAAAGEATGEASPPTGRAGSAAPAPRAATAPRGASSAPVSRPRSAAAVRPAEAPARSPVPAAAPTQRIAAAAAAPQADDHWMKMSDDLSRCTREDFINRVICDQRVRIRYCGGYWGKVAQCPVSPSTQEVR